MRKFADSDDLMNSTIGEILGKPTGKPPPEKVLTLIASVLKKMVPDGKWFVDYSYFNDRVDITLSHLHKMKGTSVLLEDGEDIGMRLFLLCLDFTHHHEWHKPISLGSLTLAPFDRKVPVEKIGGNASGWKTYPQWYFPLAEQEKFFREHPEKVEEEFARRGVFEEVKELRKKLGGL